VPLVFARRLYLDHSAQVVDEKANALRILLSDWVDARANPGNTALQEALSELCVRTLVLKDPRNLGQIPLKADAVAQIEGFTVMNIDPQCR